MKRHLLYTLYFKECAERKNQRARQKKQEKSMIILKTAEAPV